MAIAAEILTRLRADASQFKAEMASASGSTKGFEDSTSRLAKVGGAALIGIAGAAAFVAVAGIKMALDAEANQARLSTAIKNVGQNYDDFADKISNAKAKSRELGFSGGEVSQSLAKLVPVTKDTGKAVQDLSLAEDIARGRKIDLSSATDILTKVENGRVGLLSRIGVNTKDATGATISQHEAIKRLTDLYGGQAAAYSETFRGKLESLEAQAKFLVSTFGALLLPVVEGFAAALADGIGWLERHQAAVIALATAIGGPLVVAIGAWIAAQAIAAGSALIDFFVGLAAAVAGLATEFELADLVLAQNTAELLIAAGATEAEAAALLQLDAAAAGFTLAMGAALVAVVAVGAAIVYFGSTDGVFERNQKAAEEWGNTLFNAAKSTGHELKALEDTHESLTARIRTNKASIQDLQENYGKYGLTLQEANNRAQQLGYSTDLLQQENALLIPRIKELREEHAKTLAVTDGVAKQLGVTIPNAAGLSSVALKDMQTAVKGSVATFGEWGTQAALNVGLGAAAIKGLTQDAAQFASAIEQSFAKATDPFAHFGDQAVVGEAELEQFFVGSQLKAQAWTGEIQRLIGEGVDKGIVMQMARAGPDSLPALDAFSAMVDQHGVAWVNSVAQSGEEAQRAVENAYNSMAITAAVKSLEIARVGKAAFADLESGGTSHLEGLLSSSDRNMAAMAYGAILQLGEVRGAVESIPANPQIIFDVNGNAVSGAVDVLRANLESITGHTWDVIVNVATEGDPVALSDRNVKHDITPLT